MPIDLLSFPYSHLVVFCISLGSHNIQPTRSVTVMSGEKRPAQAAFGSSNQLVVKRKRSDGDINAGTAVVKSSSQNGTLVQAIPRTSGLDAPIMELTGEAEG